MSERSPLHLPIRGTNGVNLRQISSENDLNKFQTALAHADEKEITYYGDIDIPINTELRLAIEEPETIQDGGDMYVGIWKKKTLLGGLMLRNYSGQINLQFWLDWQAQGRGIATKAVSAFTNAMLIDNNLDFEIIARLNEYNENARRVLERSGYFDIKQTNPFENELIFGALRQIEVNDIYAVKESETVTHSAELVSQALQALDLRFDEDEEDKKFIFYDFNITTEKGEKVEVEITHDRKINLITIDTYQEIMDENEGSTRRDDHQYLLHTSCAISDKTKKIADFYQEMIVRDYRGVDVKLPENKTTNSPVNKRDKLPEREDLRELAKKVPTFQMHTMLKHNEEEILELLDIVMANF